MSDNRPQMEDVPNLSLRGRAGFAVTEDLLASIAVSLKRIADALEALAKGHFTP